ncbi:hypothetical protein MA16_Dca027877 [Dendrobium catenatum]|uniref:Uncharacterized protein n=1 Tax=Dendrobium catenatum TaxID=906689 RepID=A0A2I0VD92_9ASPA|nr:hypothetical protein MA16_Dca027877 [Dendrobium catenatum]
MKLKGIDEGLHKRWSMWFNSMQSEEPYQGLKGELNFVIFSFQIEGLSQRMNIVRWDLIPVAQALSLCVPRCALGRVTPLAPSLLHFPVIRFRGTPGLS